MVFNRSKATCAAPLCEALSPCRGRRPLVGPLSARHHFPFTFNPSSTSRRMASERCDYQRYCRPFSVPPNYRAGSVHSKGNFPYRQTRLCEIAKALIFVFRPRDAAAHFLALKPSSTSRRMASARVGRSLCFAAHASNALSGLGCKRTTTCTPGLELRGFGASTNCILIN